MRVGSDFCLTRRHGSFSHQCKPKENQARSYGDFPGGTVVKNPPANAGDARDAGLIPRLGRSPGEGNGNPFQYSCPENSMDGRQS